jgi:hypothetical protein
MPPDPSQFDKPNANVVGEAAEQDAGGKSDENVKAAATTPVLAEPAEPAAAAGEGVLAAAEAPAKASVASAAPVAEATSPMMTNTLFVVGLPLGAAVLLVGVFWVILRGGAV